MLLAGVSLLSWRQSSVRCETAHLPVRGHLPDDRTLTPATKLRVIIESFCCRRRRCCSVVVAINAARFVLCNYRLIVPSSRRDPFLCGVFCTGADLFMRISQPETLVIVDHWQKAFRSCCSFSLAVFWISFFFLFLFVFFRFPSTWYYKKYLACVRSWRV